MSDFSSLKRNRAGLDKLTKAIESTTQNPNTNSRDDDRYWKPEVDKAGNGYAVIRFLPAPAVDGDEALPWVRYWDHGFQGPGGWYIENCLTTIEGKCPACEHNSTLWNSGIEANKKIVSTQKRRLHYVSNILVVSDPAHPENDGQIKLFTFGKKIFDKLTEAMNPEFADETPLNPFDLWEGANFKLKIRNVEGYRNYDKSEFADKSPVHDGDDAKLEALWKAEHSLTSIVSKDNFKSYDELKVRLDKTLGFSGNLASTPMSRADQEDDFTSQFEERAPKVQSPSTPEITTGSDSDDDLNFFKSLAEES
jgi:hypothetical protein